MLMDVHDGNLFLARNHFGSADANSGGSSSGTGRLTSSSPNNDGDLYYWYGMGYYTPYTIMCNCAASLLRDHTFLLPKKSPYPMLLEFIKPAPPPTPCLWTVQTMPQQQTHCRLGAVLHDCIQLSMLMRTRC